MALATLATPASASAAERHTLPRAQQYALALQTPTTIENPMADAESNACIHRADSFELGSVDDGTFNDGMRILSSIGGYYAESNAGSIEQQFARADRYEASLQNCSADDLRVAAFFIDTWFPETQTETDALMPIRISARSFATAEIRGRLEQAVLRERRSGV